jgi:hypothetical protein
MSKSLRRLVFALAVVGAPLVMLGCSEGEKPAATTTPETTTTAPAPGPAATPAPGEAAPATPAAPTAPAEAPK